MAAGPTQPLPVDTLLALLDCVAIMFPGAIKVQSKVLGLGGLTTLDGQLTVAAKTACPEATGAHQLGSLGSAISTVTGPLGSGQSRQDETATAIGVVEKQC